MNSITALSRRQRVRAPQLFALLRTFDDALEHLDDDVTTDDTRSGEVRA